MTTRFKKIRKEDLHIILENAFHRFHTIDFIPDDPILIPHRFKQKQDIEIMGFLTATIAWGNRKSIIKSAERIMQWMGDTPHDFILNHQDSDLKPFESFVHRTFNATDILYFIHRLRMHYQNYNSLEPLFADGMAKEDMHTGNGLVHFHKRFFESEHAPQRTRKHVATPSRKSACKRLNMFLRWMVRSQEGGVDFGLWNQIKPKQLLLPLDVHVHRVATTLGLLQRKQADWKACMELSNAVRRFDPDDPAKYDFALFGLGVEGKLA